MKSFLATVLFITAMSVRAGVPDSVYVRPTCQSNGGGMFLEWSSDGAQWKQATSGRILSSDFGAWGSEKKLYSPSMCRGANGVIALVFQVNNRCNQFAVASTHDFIHWRPQDYPIMQGVGQCLEPVIFYHNSTYNVFFHDANGKYFMTRSHDLIEFSHPRPVEVETVPTASPLRVPYTMVQALNDNQQAFNARQKHIDERASGDETRFAKLTDVCADVHVSAENPKSISDKLMGIFFEDINYSADGGLNAQLVQNGDFEYTPHNRKGDKNWNAQTDWSHAQNLRVEVIEDGVSKNNTHALRVLSDGSAASDLTNAGFDGMALQKGAKYDLTLSLRGDKGTRVRVILDGAEGTITLKGSGWQTYKLSLTAKQDNANAKLVLRFLTAGVTDVDMVSLMPRDTYKGHGLRRDLCETLAALHPRFMRFPGGCVSHGDGLGNIYMWKETIGDQKDRKPQRNLWGYHQSRQIGFYEFFQMCEDMQMEPLPVLSAGVPCQNSSDGGYGQMGGIPMEAMPSYIQDILDLIEWANGDATTTWGAKRIAQGHKKPFGLHMIGIGNEDLISPTFETRYLMICKAIHEKYPEIQICGTAGPFYYGSDYDEGWRIATKNKDKISLVDEHYYVSPGWYIWNQDFYDQYDRTAPKVYLGEWASHISGRKSTIETALSCALHYCGLERNGDVVAMSSYAPLLAKEGYTQWNPDMIYFNNTEVHPTVDYYSQMMCGQSAGDQYLASSIRVDTPIEGVNERLAISTVRDSKTGKTYLKLVNLLPREVTAKAHLDGVLSTEKVCKTTTLTGTYDSRDARPTEGQVTLSPECELTLPAYSFTVVEL